MASPSSDRTPDQLAIVRDSINKIADPAARQQDLRNLESEIALAQTHAIQNGAGQIELGNTKPGSEYQPLLDGVRADIAQVNSAANRVPKTAPSSAGERVMVDDPNNPGQQVPLDVAKLDIQLERAQNTSSSKDQQLLIQQQKAALDQKNAYWLDQLRQAQISGKNTQLVLNQAKLDLSQQVAAANAALKDEAYRTTLEKADQTNAVNLLGQESTAANTRSTNAASILNNTGNLALDVAKGGGTAGQIGNVLSGMLGVAPDFQASIGGAPVGFDAGHLQQVLNLIKSGQVQPDANGSVVAPAIKAVANANGVSGGPLPSFGPNNSPMADGSGAPAPVPSITIPNITAPPAGRYQPTDLVAAGL